MYMYIPCKCNGMQICIKFFLKAFPSQLTYFYHMFVYLTTAIQYITLYYSEKVQIFRK